MGKRAGGAKAKAKGKAKAQPAPEVPRAAEGGLIHCIVHLCDVMTAPFHQPSTNRLPARPFTSLPPVPDSPQPFHPQSQSLPFSSLFELWPCLAGLLPLALQPPPLPVKQRGQLFQATLLHVAPAGAQQQGRTGLAASAGHCAQPKGKAKAPVRRTGLAATAGPGAQRKGKAKVQVRRTGLVATAGPGAQRMGGQSAQAKAKAQVRRRKTKKSRGLAEPLLSLAWICWAQHVLACRPTWLYVASCLTHLFCCRITEITRFTVEDFTLDDEDSPKVQVAALNKQAAVEKPLSEAAVAQLKKWKEEGGVCVLRKRRRGCHGSVSIDDKWVWPESGLLSSTVAKAIRVCRQTFCPCWHAPTSKLTASAATAADDGVWHKYGRVTSEQAGIVLGRNKALQQSWRSMY